MKGIISSAMIYISNIIQLIIKIMILFHFIRVPTDSPINYDTLSMNYSLSFNNFDLGINMKLNKNVSYAFGPTISFVQQNC